MSHLLRGNQISFTRIFKDRRPGEFLSRWNNAGWLHQHRLTVHQNNRIPHRVVRSWSCFETLRNIIIQRSKSLSIELIKNRYPMKPSKFWKASKNCATPVPTWMLAVTISLCDPICFYSYSCSSLSLLFGNNPYRQARRHRHPHRRPRHRPRHRHHFHHHRRRLIVDVVPLADPIFVIFRIIMHIHRRIMMFR